MLKSKSKKAFTLVEVICSLSIFSIIFMSMISYDIVSMNMTRTIKNTNENLYIMEALKNNIIHTMTFEELEGLQKDNKIYINNENLTAYKIQNGMSNIFSDQALEDNPYIKLSFLKCELEVYTLRLSLYDNKQSDMPELQCDFYKGNYN